MMVVVGDKGAARFGWVWSSTFWFTDSVFWLVVRLLIFNSSCLQVCQWPGRKYSFKFCLYHQAASSHRSFQDDSFSQCRLWPFCPVVSNPVHHLYFSATCHKSLVCCSLKVHSVIPFYSQIMHVSDLLFWFITSNAKEECLWKSSTMHLTWLPVFFWLCFMFRLKNMLVELNLAHEA